MLIPADLRCEYLREPLAIDAAPPRLSWTLRSDGAYDVVQTGYRVQAATRPELLDANAPDAWDSGVVDADATVGIPYGGDVVPGRRVHWRVACRDKSGGWSGWSDLATWRAGLGASPFIGQAIGETSADPGAVAYVRREFDLDAVPDDALLYVSALGICEVHVNGVRADDALLVPEWTDYRRRLLYRAVDATTLLRAGRNAIGIVVADGWYSGHVGLNAGRAVYGRVPRVLARLDAGGRTVLVSDASWRVTTSGPIRAADLLGGEHHDLRLDLQGWDLPGYDDAGWAPVAAEELPEHLQLSAHSREPIRIQRVIPASKVGRSPSGNLIFDVGENIVGVCHVEASGPTGGRVTLRHGEALEKDGSLYRENLRVGLQTGETVLGGALQEDTFVLDGEAREHLEPRFTTHGFRFVEIEVDAPDVVLEAVHAAVIASDLRRVGRFECSEPLLETLVENTVRTMLGNSVGLPTDCPQRDERLGWTGDAQLFAPTAALLHDVASFHQTWLTEVRGAQLADGRLPDIAPNPFGPPKSPPRFFGNPGWADAGVMLPWHLYVAYGDPQILHDAFGSAQRWIDYIDNRNPDHRFRHGRPEVLEYGDWLNGDTLRLEGWPESGAEMPKEAFATAWFARSTRTLARSAAALGRSADWHLYGALADRIDAAFTAAYVSSDGLVAGGSQAASALALHFGLVPHALEPLVFEKLVAAVEARGRSASTGIHSTAPLLLQLSRRGRHDLALELALRTAVPSWGAMINAGATTIWERWDGYVPGRGFQQPVMNSLNHVAFGSVVQWVFECVAGVSPDERGPGYRHIRIAPNVGRLTRARATIDSVRGRVESAWRREGAMLEMNVVVPPNAAATIVVPTNDPNGVVLEPPRTPVLVEPDRVGYEVGSGVYIARASTAPS